jgi:hypothetical protein
MSAQRYFCAVLIFAVNGGESQLHAPAALSPGKEPPVDSHWLGIFADLVTGLDVAILSPRLVWADVVEGCRVVLCASPIRDGAIV